MELLLAKLLDWLLSRCKHPDHILRADILEGDIKDEAVQWCLYCGAYKRSNGWEYRRPRPVWALRLRDYPLPCELLLASCLTVYGPGAISYTPILERVAERRVLNEWGLSADWREYDVLVGVANCNQLDRSGWLIVDGRILTAKVVDCEADVHAGIMESRGLLADASRRGLNHKAGWLVLR